MIYICNKKQILMKSKTIILLVNVEQNSNVKVIHSREVIYNTMYIKQQRNMLLQYEQRYNRKLDCLFYCILNYFYRRERNIYKLIYILLSKANVLHYLNYTKKRSIAGDFYYTPLTGKNV